MCVIYVAGFTLCVYDVCVCVCVCARSVCTVCVCVCVHPPCVRYVCVCGSTLNAGDVSVSFLHSQKDTLLLY